METCMFKAFGYEGCDFRDLTPNTERASMAAAAASGWRSLSHRLEKEGYSVRALSLLTASRTRCSNPAGNLRSESFARSGATGLNPTGST